MPNLNKLVCKRCIMDSINDPDILINDDGVCNHCITFDFEFNKLPKGINKEKELESIIKKIKLKGVGRKYDCLLGVSGGVDSSYLAYLCSIYGLRPLIIHFDNGWNSELSVLNIQNLLDKLGFDFETLVINWDEFKDLQLSYFKAGVVDLEFPTDHAILASMFKIAKKHNIKFVLSGHNVVTEGTYLPKSWVHSKLDYLNLKDIHKQYGSIKLKTYPYLSFIKRLYNFYNSQFEYIQLLNFVDYNKFEVKKKLISELSWKDYGGKHFESIFTRFYQGYILPNKFNIDKRVFHYSCLVQSEQITREQAIKLLQEPIYDINLLESDKKYVLKKLNFNEATFEDYMRAPIRKHNEFKSEQKYWNKYFFVIKQIKKVLFKK
jgi:N-acetyl sugar amidotransferase